MSTLSQSDVNSHLSPPPKDLGDELVLLAARVPRVVLQTADIPPARSRQSVALRIIQESVCDQINITTKLFVKSLFTFVPKVFQV